MATERTELTAKQAEHCKHGCNALTDAIALLERCAKTGDDVAEPLEQCRKIKDILTGYLQEFGTPEQKGF